MENGKSIKKPNLTKPFLDYFLKLPLKNKILVEIGSGDSFYFWKTKFKTVYSYEDDTKYLKEGMYSFDHYYYEDDQFKNHLKQADYVIIDNNPNRVPRYDFASFVPRYTNGIIILDNSYWHLTAYNILFKIYFNKDFPGKNALNEDTVTSIFETRKDLIYKFYKG